jgi:hypothetical protein
MCSKNSKKPRGIDLKMTKNILEQCQRVLDRRVETPATQDEAVELFTEIRDILLILEEQIMLQSPTQEEIERFFAVSGDVWLEISACYRLTGRDSSFAESFCTDMFLGCKREWSRAPTWKQVKEANKLLDDYEEAKNSPRYKLFVFLLNCRRLGSKVQQNLFKSLSWQ